MRAKVAGRVAPPIFSGDCPPQVKREPKERQLNERNLMSPAVECSRHGSVREIAVAR
jgi:hypothetical protein